MRYSQVMTRVSGMDVMLLYGETPTWHTHVSALQIVDPSTAPGGFDAEIVRSLLAERLALAPPFRWKVREVAFGLDRPVLVDEGDFDLDRHFHHLALPRPGDRRQLSELVGKLMARKIDRSHALWEIWLLEGLEGGRVAMLTKIHHAVIDGASGVDLTGLLMDPGPVPVPRQGMTVDAPDPAPSAVAAVAGAAGRTLLTPVRTARYAAQFARQAAVAGQHLLRGTAAGLPWGTGKSSLNGALTAQRRFAFVDVPLADVLRVKDAFGVKVNAVVLALAAGALRDYLVARDDLPSRALVAEVPVNIRTEATRRDVGSRVANTFVTLATDTDDPVERLRTIHRSSEDAKALQHDLATRKHINLSDVLPPVLLGAVVRGYGSSGLEPRVPPIYSVIISNIRGPDIDLYMAGAKVVGIYPMGPLLYASGLNITMLSLGDRVHFGLVACPDVVRDPWAVADLLPVALADLVEHTRIATS